MSTSPFERVYSYFDEVNLASAVAALKSYFGAHHHYTGAAFDQLISTSPQDSFESLDIVAVSMLSVNVPPRAALALLEGVGNQLLSEIPSDATLWANPDALDRGRAAWKLWNLLEEYGGVGRTIASKLLAAKRPALLPVYDQHVATALGVGFNYWAFWQDVARQVVAANDGILLTSVERARSAAGVPLHVSALRIIDVVVWMRHHGWRVHRAACRLGCDLSAFAIH